MSGATEGRNVLGMAMCLALALGAAWTAGCLGPSQGELASYQQRQEANLGEVLPAARLLAGRLAFVDGVSAPGSFLEIDQKTLVAALRQRKLFAEVADLGREGTPAAARQAGFDFILRFTEGGYRRHTPHHHENRLGRYLLTELLAGASREISLDLEDDSRVLVVPSCGVRIDTGRDHGVDAGTKLKALVQAVEHGTAGLLAARKPAAGGRE